MRTETTLAPTNLHIDDAPTGLAFPNPSRGLLKAIAADNSPSCAEEAPRVLAPSSFSTGLLPNATISIVVEFHAKTCVSKAPIENGAVDFSLNSEYFEEQPSEQPFDQNKMATDLTASHLIDFIVLLAPRVGLEPTTCG